MKELISKLENKAKLNLSEKERIMFEKDLISFMKQIELINEINLENISPSIFPFEEKAIVSTFLREDNSVSNNNENVFKNSKNTLDDKFILKEK